jgi:copper transport protein
VAAGSTAGVVAGFSATATVAVALLTLTGVAQGWRQLGGIDALWSTTYGRLLVAKVALVAAMVALGARNRQVVRSVGSPSPAVGPTVAAAAPSLAVAGRAPASGREADDRDGPPPPPTPPPTPTPTPGGGLGWLRRRVRGEVALGVAVVALTAVLVNAVPGRELGDQPFSATVAAADGATLSITVDPAGLTGNEVHLIVTPSAEQGLDLTVEEASLALSAPGRDVAGIDVPLSRAGSRHFVAEDLDFPFAGTWHLVVTTRFDQFSNARFEAALDVS